MSSLDMLVSYRAEYAATTAALKSLLKSGDVTEKERETAISWLSSRQKILADMIIFTERKALTENDPF